MAKARLQPVISFLRRIIQPADASRVADAQLLERFVKHREEAAFELLVWRHERMVLGVCQRVLRDRQDIEDAFQATFLILVRKARSIGKRESVASWLYKVAFRCALRAKTSARKRTAREKHGIDLSTAQARSEPTADMVWRDLRPVLDQEINSLPEKYRQPVVLCYLAGKTYAEAASELGCSPGTISTRLTRARELLRHGLSRYGLVLSGSVLTIALCAHASSAAVPATLVDSTVRAALLFAAGEVVTGTVSNAATLAQGVLKTMFMNKLRIAALLLLAVSGVGAADLLTRGVLAGPANPAPTQGGATGTAGLNFQRLAGEEPKGPTKVAGQKIPKATDKEAKPGEGPDDAKILQGEWQAVDGEKGGKPLAEDPSDMRIIFKGDEITIFDQGKKKYRLDTRKSPRELHINVLDGKLKGQTVRMIYALEKDELKLCMPLGPEIACPTEFKTKAGSNLLLLVLRRAPRDAAAVKRPDDLANVKREWRRADAAPDGNYKLSYVWETYEETICLIKLETKDGKQSASLVDTVEGLVTAVRALVPTVPPPSGRTGQAPGEGVPIRLVCTRSWGELVFDGSFSPPSLEARGYLETGAAALPATLIATDLTKLKFTTRSLPATPLQKALELRRTVDALRQRAAYVKDAKKKADFVKEAALAEKAALVEAPKLFREGFEKFGDDPLIFGAAVDAARFATKYQIPVDQLRAMIAKADKFAASYGRGWQREFNLQIAAALAAQKDYAALALDIATRLEKELVATDAAATRQRLLKALAAAEANAGSSGAVRETLARLLAKMEETLDSEYRAKVPPFKPVSFTGRKSRSDRAVVLELFTGTQCPPCVAAGVAFDALHETYRPAELVLIQYHLHIPGPDPLANADSEARMMYYAKSFPDEVGGVPTTLFNGKPAGGYGGDMTQAEAKYKEYRRLIDPLFETASGAKLSASAVKQGNKVNIKVEVTDLKKPGHDVRLRLLLVEETVRYVGGNRVRFHHHVVRSMIGGADGFALNDKDSKHTAAVDLEVLRTSLNSYLEDYNRNRRPFPNSDRPLDLSDLRLIALVQDDVTREIIQATEVEIIAQGKTATK